MLGKKNILTLNKHTYELKTLGATKCKYYISEDKNLGKIFIKIGEKVNNEIKNYNFLKTKNKVVLPLLATTDEGGLVLPYVENKNYGFDMVNQLWNNQSFLNDFLIFQNEVFKTVKQFYQENNCINTNSKSFYSHMFTNRLLDRLRNLEKIKNQEIFIDTNKKTYLKNILFKKNIYYLNNKFVELPSILNMVKTVTKVFKSNYSWSPMVIHGDLQVSNIVLYKNNVILTDLSDIRVNEDICWDFAKWMNYINRFHIIVKTRDINQVFSPNKIPFLSKNLKSKIFDSLLQTIESDYSLKKTEIKKRILYAEFIINVSTLKRHILLFPNSTPLVIKAINESYLELMENKI